MLSFFHGFGHGETWIWMVSLLDLDLFWFSLDWIWTVFLDLDLFGFFDRFGLVGFSFSTGFWFFSDLDLFGLLLDWIDLVFLWKRIFRFSVGFGSQTVFSKSSYC